MGHYIAHIKDEVCVSPFHFCRSMFYSRRALSSLVLPGTSTKKWWRFDDAVVTPLDEAKIGIEKEPKKNKKKGAALPEGYCYQKEEREERGVSLKRSHVRYLSLSVLFRMTESSNSYMLIYALKDRETVAQPQLPASAQAFVDIGTP